jgi:2-oxoglutarate dehydrogenase E2 component (dihydrolipoamide succinyltransferase)
MRTSRKLFAASVAAIGMFVLAVPAAMAQTPIDPSITPVKNLSPTAPLGPFPSLADLLMGLAVVVVLLLTVRYMRYAPRFTRDEQTFKTVRADRVRPGTELPRRAVDVSQASPTIVAPPAVPVALAAVPAPVAAPAAAAPVPAAAAPAPAAAPAAAAPAAPAAAPAAPAAAPAPAAPAERPEVALDQETFEKTLQELLAKGTDRRVAEGQARRAGMIAARKKAGEG